MPSSSSEAFPPFTETLAHPGDPLPEHLLRVATAARSELQTAGASTRRIGLVAALCHDVGKATRFFQVDRLQRRTRSEHTNHSLVGSVWSWWASAGLSDRERLSVVAAVLRHHGRLKDNWLGELRSVLSAAREGQVLREQLSAMDVAGASRFIRDTLQELAGEELLPEPVSSADDILALLPRSAMRLRAKVEPFGLNDAVDFLAGFGALVAADRVDTALEGGAVGRPPLPAEAVNRYKSETFGEPASESELNHRREAIAQAVETTFLEHADHRLFTLTSPTGSGKTLAVLNAALRRRHARPGHVPRIIYCLPFTSVIDQNERVFAEVLRASGVPLTSDVLLKHHHLSEKGFRTADQQEHEEDGAGRLLTESWQSELVVSTFHQLLHSLLSVKTRHLQRASRLTGALVILDEVQAIPLKYWRGIGEILAAAAERLDTTFVLCTATRPLILPPGSAVELLPDHDAHFEAMTRTRLRCAHQGRETVSSFGEELAEHLADGTRSSLIILNRKRAVAELHALLSERLSGLSVRALSTNLTPADRLERIREIRQRLDAGEKLVVVSTQLVEAGVDFSFDEVHRDLAPLDCIIQSAGRCNRGGRAETGSVTLWQLVDDSEAANPLWHHVYDGALVGATTEALGETREVSEAGFLDLSQRYFEICVARGESSEIHRWLAEGRFDQIRKDFKLIEQLPSQAYFVCRTEHDEQLWATYRAWRQEQTPASHKAFRAVERDFMERVVERYEKQPADEVLRIGAEHYDPELGLSIRNAPPSPQRLPGGA